MQPSVDPLVYLLHEDPYFEQVSIGRTRHPYLPGWRHAFSMRLFKADAFERSLSVARKLAQSGGKEWNEVREECRRVLEAPPENPVLENMVEIPKEPNLRAAAKLGLLRVAVRFVRTGEVVSHVDPYGPMQRGEKRLPGGGREFFWNRASFRFKAEGDRLRVWSVGPDGNNEAGEAVKGIVLEVTR